MDVYLLIKLIHILSSTILFGTGLGIAFFMFRSVYTDNINEKYYMARNTVIADYCFTLPAVIVQPLSGAWLVWQIGYDWTSFWLVATYILYAIAGICWIPVVWIQIRLRNLARENMEKGTTLPEQFSCLFRLWFMLGWPAFLSLVAIFYLMVVKPS